MTKVKLADWCDRWKHGNINDKDYFSISTGQVKETSDEILMLSMGRLIKAEKQEVNKTWHSSSQND